MLTGLALFLNCLTPAYGEYTPVSLRLRWFHQFQFAGYYAALEKGFYLEAGLDVTIKEGAPNIDAVADVLSGQSDFGVSNSNLVVEYLKGKPTLMLAPIFQHSPLVLIAPGKEEHLAHLADGRPVALGADDTELKAMFLSEGIALNRIRFVPYDRPLEALLKGPVSAFSAYFSSEPYLLNRRKIPYTLFKPQTYGLDFYGDSLFTGQALWQREPSLIAAFREASLKGWRYALDHPGELIDLILERYNTQGKNRADLESEAQAVLDLIDPDIIEIGHSNPNRWRHIADTYIRLGVAEPGASLDRFLYDPAPKPLPGWVMPALAGSTLAFLIAFTVASYLIRLKRLVGLAQEDTARLAHRHARMLENSRDGIWLVDTSSGRVLDANAAAERMSGYSRVELLSMQVSDFDADETTADVKFRLGEVLVSGWALFESRHKTKDGHVINVEVSVMPDLENGTALAFVRDITQRKQAEHAQAFLLQCGLLSNEEDFFASLARYLAETLSMETVCIDRLEGDGLHAQTVAIYNDGRFDNNHRYPLKDTPCGSVLDGSTRCFPHGVCGLFPDDVSLTELRAESYIGTVLWGSQGRPIGLIAVIGRHPLKDPQRADALLKLVGPRAAWELERREAKRYLQESEERLRLALKAAKQGLYDLDMRTGEIQVSDEYALMLGYDPAEFHENREHWLARLYPGDTDPVGLAYRDYVEGRTADFQVEFRQRTRSGAWKWILSVGSIVERDGEGHPLRMLGTHTDITERKEAENWLRESERRFRELFEHSPDPSWIIGDHKFVLCNTAAMMHLGYEDREALLNTHPGELSPQLQPDGQLSRDKAEEMMAQAMAQGGTRFEWVHLRRDGSVFPVEVTLSRIDWRNQPALYCVWRDISERKRIDGELRQYREHLEATVRARTEELTRANQQLNDIMFALESVGTAIFWAETASGQFLKVNHPAAQMLGYTREELKQLAVPDIDPNFKLEDYRRIAQAIPKKGHIRFDTTLLRKSGELIPVEMTIFHQDGTPPLFIGFGVEISERKATEQALRDAKAAAEAATQAKSAFLANMSHEIRTPMNAILGLTQLLYREITEPMQQERLSKIQMAGKHLLSIINDILDVSKIEAGKVELERIVFPISDILDHVYSLIAEQARAKGLTLQVDSGDVPLWLKGDPTRLRQALLNYVGNAIKFTERGTISLRAILLEEEGDNLLVRFEVHDTGRGISAEAMGKLFQLFGQADNAMTRKHGGTGLGLAITKRLAELMGGEAGAESELDGGSTFWFTARLERGIPPAVTNEARQSRKAEPLFSTYPGLRILLVEDNELNQEVALGWLRDTGLVVDVAANGLEALRMAAKTTYALILMDMQMPEMDGIEATRAIRQLPSYQTIPILAMTANAFGEDRDACLAAGMNDHIPKPVDPAMLNNKLAIWLTPVTPAKDALPVDVSSSTMVSIDQPQVFDAVEALRYWPNQQTFRRLLAKFADDYPNLANDIGGLIDAGMFVEASQLAHKLKGMAGMFGFMALLPIVTGLEQTLKARDVDPAHLHLRLAIFHQTFVETLGAIQSYLGPPAATEVVQRSAPGAVDTVAVAPILQEILATLAQNSPYRAEALLDEVSVFLTAEQTTPVKLLIDRFDFRGAEAEVRKLASSLNIEIKPYRSYAVD